MTYNCLLQPDVLEFLSGLSYLSGYKTAVFDTKIRFESTDRKEVERWKRERDAIEKLISFVQTLIAAGREIELTALEAELVDRINLRRAELGIESLEYQAELFETERAIGLISNIQKMKLAA